MKPQSRERKSKTMNHIERNAYRMRCLLHARDIEYERETMNDPTPKEMCALLVMAREIEPGDKMIIRETWRGKDAD